MRFLYNELIWIFVFLNGCYIYYSIEFHGKNGNYFRVTLTFILCIVYTWLSIKILDFIYSHIYTVIYLRKLFYSGWIKNEKLQKYLDSILFFKYYLLYWDSGIHQKERRKNYIFAFLTFPFTFVILLVPFIATVFRAIYMIKVKSARYSTRNHYLQMNKKFHFEKIPLSFRDRFFELLSPLTTKRLKQIYPRVKFDDLLIDKLHIDAETPPEIDRELVKHKRKTFVIAEEINWENIGESWNFGQSYFEFETLLVVRFCDARKFGWNLEKIKSLKIVKTVIFTKLKPMEFQNFYNNLNLTFISELEIKDSNLSRNELILIKNLNLKSIYLSIKVENDSSRRNFEMIEFIMDIFEKIPKIRVFFDCVFDEKSFNFENFLVDWIIKNGYRESFSFTFPTPSFPWYLTFSGNSLFISGFNCFQLPI